MIEESGNRIVKEVLLSLAKFFTRQIGKLISFTAKITGKKINEKLPNNNKHSIKKLMKKNPRTGYYSAKDLKIDEAKNLCKQLRKMNQDFVVKKDVDNKYAVTVIGSNKELCEYILNDYANKKKQQAANKSPKESTQDKLKRFKAQAKKHKSPMQRHIAPMSKSR